MLHGVGVKTEMKAKVHTKYRPHDILIRIIARKWNYTNVVGVCFDLIARDTENVEATTAQEIMEKLLRQPKPISAFQLACIAATIASHCYGRGYVQGMKQ